MMAGAVSEIIFSRDVSSILWCKRSLDVTAEVANDAKCLFLFQQESRGKWELQVSPARAFPSSLALRSLTPILM